MCFWLTWAESWPFKPLGQCSKHSQNRTPLSSTKCASPHLGGKSSCGATSWSSWHSSNNHTFNFDFTDSPSGCLLIQAFLLRRNAEMWLTVLSSQILEAAVSQDEMQYAQDTCSNRPSKQAFSSGSRLAIQIVHCTARDKLYPLWEITFFYPQNNPV